MKMWLERTRWTLFRKTGKSPWSTTKYDHTIKAWWNGDLNNVGGHLSDGLSSVVSRLTVKVSELASRFILMATPMKVANTIVARCLLHPSFPTPNAHAEREKGRVCFKIQQVVRLIVTMLPNVLAFAIVSARKRDRSSTWRPSTSATSEVLRNLRKRIWLDFWLRIRFEQSLWTFRVWYWRARMCVCNVI